MENSILNSDKVPTLCLNMIVKNESKIITRLLESVLPIIDTYCICDTGSTDNTKEIIKDFFDKRNIQGKIVEEPFKNFEYSRNLALSHCINMPSDFVLLLDADMIFQIKNFNKKKLLTGDAFTILQGNDNFYYQNLRIVKNNGLFKYKGVTHEYISTPPNTKIVNITKDELFINDIGDGGAKSDKFERDIRLLTEGIKAEPDNARYYFYLANSYHDSGKFEEAIESYLKRIEKGGWNQEVWYSYYKIGLCYKKLNKMNEAIQYWLEGYNYYDDRLENLYEIINYYRMNSKYKLAKIYYDIAINILNKEINRDTMLFLHKDVYTYKLFFEYTIIAYYLGKMNIKNETMQILNYSNDNNMILQLLKNLKFYKLTIPVTKKINLTNTLEKTINEEVIKLNSSSPSIIQNKNRNGYFMNIRYVNYNINKENGSYSNCDKYIITINKFVKLDKNFNIIEEKILDSVNDNRKYIGIEDVRLYMDNNNKIVFMGTGYHKNNHLGITYGDYDTNKDILDGNDIKPTFSNNDCEKNWVFVNYKNETHIIYSWSPLRICKLNTKKNILNLVEKKEMPQYFKMMRGSTNGFSYENEIWFLTHIVSYENPRHYYHAIVVFDKNLNLLRYTSPLKFDSQSIEYSLGLIVESDRVLITYSTWDSTSNIGIYDKKLIDKLFI